MLFHLYFIGLDATFNNNTHVSYFTRDESPSVICVCVLCHHLLLNLPPLSLSAPDLPLSNDAVSILSFCFVVTEFKPYHG